MPQCLGYCLRCQRHYVWRGLLPLLPRPRSIIRWQISVLMIIRWSGDHPTLCWVSSGHWHTCTRTMCRIVSVLPQGDLSQRSREALVYKLDISWDLIIANNGASSWSKLWEWIDDQMWPNKIISACHNHSKPVTWIILSHPPALPTQLLQSILRPNSNFTTSK